MVLLNRRNVKPCSLMVKLLKRNNIIFTIAVLKIMKYLTLAFLIYIAVPVYSQEAESNQQKAIAVLFKSAAKLNSLTSLRYDLKREANYASENYLNITEWSCYFNFDKANSITGFKYQIDHPKSTDIFNGTEMFALSKSDKTIQIVEVPQKSEFESLSYLYNSIVTLRNILPLLIEDNKSTKIVTDTIINNHTYEVVTINLGKRRIQNLGEGFDKMQTKSNFIYKILIDKIDYFPVEIIQRNDLNTDFIKTSFSKIDIHPNLPAENTWYYSTYLDVYKRAHQIEMPRLIPVGSIAPDWTLPLYNSNENVSLTQFNGKVVLLEFWFKNCGPCIASVPHLNAMERKYKGKNFEIVAINTWDSKQDIEWFYKKHQLSYKVVMNGKDLATKYGINAFPTVILLNKEGKVLYAGGFDPSEIERLVEKAL